MASEVGICNRALQRVGAARITSLADDNKNARACNAAYEPLRDAALRAHPWSFAISRAALAADVTAPVGDGDELRSYRYPWPTDALRILLPKDGGVDWIVEGRYILSDWTAPLYVRYIAQEICEELTQSNNKKASAQQDMAAIVAEARRTNAIERLPASPPDGSWDTVRL